MQTWLVSLDLPIEADSAGDAVRQFWAYVRDLGPDELPTFVSPTYDELSMQAMVAGVPVNLDPEEDEQPRSLPGELHRPLRDEGGHRVDVVVGRPAQRLGL